MDVIAYEVNRNWAPDGDHHTLPMYMLNISSVGSSAYAIWWNGEQNPEEGAAPAGMGVSSFTAEATAAESALIKVSKRVMQGWRGRTRIVTDSRTLLDSLQTPDHWNNFFFFLLYVIFWKRKVLVVPLQ